MIERAPWRCTTGGHLSLGTRPKIDHCAGVGKMVGNARGNWPSTIESGLPPNAVGRLERRLYASGYTASRHADAMYRKMIQTGDIAAEIKDDRT